MGNPRRISLMISIVVFSSNIAACSSDGGAADGGLDAGADSGTDTDTDSDTDTDTDTDTAADAGALEIIGDYHEDWGAEHHVTADDWTVVFPGLGDAGPTTSVVHITSFDNAADYLVAQNDHDLSYNPDLWSRYDWTFEDLSDGGVDLYYCQIEYAAADEETAAANEGADPDDLGGGCGAFPWSRLIED
jgi:hypothetical protein